MSNTLRSFFPPAEGSGGGGGPRSTAGPAKKKAKPNDLSGKPIPPKNAAGKYKRGYQTAITEAFFITLPEDQDEDNPLQTIITCNVKSEDGKTCDTKVPTIEGSGICGGFKHLLKKHFDGKEGDLVAAYNEALKEGAGP